MTRTFRPCSSSGQRGPAPVRPEWHARRRAPPSLRRRRLHTPSARRARACRGIAASDAARARSAPFLYEFREIGGDRWLALMANGHARAFLLNHDLFTRLAFIRLGIITAGVGAAALGSLQP